MTYSAHPGGWRHACARVVVLAGLLALTATSEPETPSYIVASDPLVTEFDVPAFATVSKRFLLVVEGHPELLNDATVLIIEGAGVPAPTIPVSPGLDGGATSTLFPIVSTNGVASLPSPRIDGALTLELTYALPYGGCSGLAYRCEREVVVALQAQTMRRTMPLTLVAGVSARGELEPPPGRVTFVELEGTP